jgi:hypothetical protein
MIITFLTSALDRDEWSASGLCRFTRYPLDRRLGETQKRCGLYGERKILLLPRNETRPPARCPSLSQLLRERTFSKKKYVFLPFHWH